MPESQIEAFGAIAISLMVACYSLEKIHSGSVALFAFGCCFASVYAYLIGSYPFVLAEGISTALDREEPVAAANIERQLNPAIATAHAARRKRL
ncbi:MAG: hypothetical protein ACR2PS_11155 [Pseudomonadales bacterium]